ncbi:hypothetical protein CHLRE_07g320093v5 [Chlamydomonas reinhardtii]|uniref:Uncharacterized protein n=1 Tax=Chlamydomonas reinhardtii TaxID=3055 RepID=A0A2K3DIZ6_CHLRE|nr:uncharacterized protein CHLRE_07g320093v5 [Chlamydomonas reinhardtii]PNW80505.1 hypothetical protein CHLRE_07g320093v5 [Chlamydomonas reinhardtii]
MSRAIRGKPRKETKEEAKARKLLNREAHTKARWAFVALLVAFVLVVVVTAFIAMRPIPPGEVLRSRIRRGRRRAAADAA